MVTRCRGAAEITEVSLYGLDSVDAAASISRDLPICEAPLLDPTPNACVYRDWKFWRHLWLACSAAGCVRCPSDYGEVARPADHLEHSLRLYPHPSTNEHRSHVHLGQCNTVQTYFARYCDCRVSFFMQECQLEFAAVPGSTQVLQPFCQHLMKSTLPPLLPSLPSSTPKHTRSIYHIRDEEFQVQAQPVQDLCGKFSHYRISVLALGCLAELHHSLHHSCSRLYRSVSP